MIAAVLALLVAQAATPAAPAAEGDQSSLTRIRTQLLQQPPAPITVVRDQSGDHPVFRLHVQGFDFSQTIWDPAGPVPGYVRPPMPIYHYEFLKQVTPQEFRASVLYPNAPTTPYGGVGIGIPVVPVIETVADMVKTAIRKTREASAREEVKAALQAYEEQRRRAQASAGSDKKY